MHQGTALPCGLVRDAQAGRCVLIVSVQRCLASLCWGGAISYALAFCLGAPILWQPNSAFTAVWAVFQSSLSTAGLYTALVHTPHDRYRVARSPPALPHPLPVVCSANVWSVLLRERAPELGAAAGAWLGAIPVLYDWGTQWQVGGVIS